MMRATKDSGFEWIGIIPTEWGLSKIGQVYRLRNTKVSDTDYPPLSVTNKGIVPQLDTAAKTNAHDDRKLVKKGDFAINSRSDRRGSCGISDYDGSVSLINTILAPLNEMNPGYYDWLFHTVQFGDEFYKFGHGIVDDLWTTGWQEMKKITIPTPPLPEQQRIADFLDAKCAEIDALVADIQTQIDTLEQYKRSVITETVTKGLNPDAEMKDSGIQWVGNMPSHWEVIRGKYILRYMQKPVREDDGVITCFRDGEVTLRSNRREDGFTMSDKEIGYQGIDVGDLVVHGMDGFAGSIGISDSRGKASPVLNVLDTYQCKRYIMYYLRSMAYSDVFLALATGIRVRSCDLRWNKLAELSYPVPPLDEQNAIVKHIDSVLSKADAVIADKKAQLATLDEYKKSLIFEYVTGKKEVPIS
jgi:type I restriction enzyme S subunit